MWFYRNTQKILESSRHQPSASCWTSIRLTFARPLIQRSDQRQPNGSSTNTRNAPYPNFEVFGCKENLLLDVINSWTFNFSEMVDVSRLSLDNLLLRMLKVFRSVQFEVFYFIWFNMNFCIILKRCAESFA